MTILFIACFIKNHTHVKKMGHNPRISVWHLLMNLKNNFFKKKNCWSGPIKNISILIFTKTKKNKNKNKNKEKHLEISLYLCTNILHDMIFLRYRVWQTEIGNYGSFFVLYHTPPWKPKKSEFWKIEKNCWRYHHFIQVHQKPQSHEDSSWHKEWDRLNFLSFWAIFCPFTPLFTKRMKIWNKFLKTPEILSYYIRVP